MRTVTVTTCAVSSAFLTTRQNYTLPDDVVRDKICQGGGRHPDHHDAEDRAEGESHQGHRGLVTDID